MRSCRTALAIALCAAAVVAGRASAQEALARAMDFEEAGRFAEAAEVYRVLLVAAPTDVAALLGAERAFAQTGRRDSTAALARRALAVDSTNRIFHIVLLRSLRALREDSLAAAAFERWVALAPRDPAPYRELARLLLAEGRDGPARALLVRGRTSLGDPTIGAAEMAQIEMHEAAFPRAAEEWRTAVAREPAMRDAAVFSLQAVLPDDREALLRVLGAGPGGAVGRAIAVDLLLEWNEPRRAWTTLHAALADAGPARLAALRHFAEGASRLDGREAARARAEALELLAAGQQGAGAARTRVESARAYMDAEDGAAARRLLRALAEATGTPEDIAAAARVTLIELSAAEGAPDDAARLLEDQRGRLPERDARRLARRVAFAFVRAGALDRAASVVAADSSLAGDEVRGWIAFYRGELRAGAAMLRAVGADAGDPARAADRAAMVALAAAVREDAMPALGAGLLRAAQGDTLGAARALAALALGLTGEAQAAVRLWAARYALSARDTAAAERLWNEVVALPGTAPSSAAAMLALARVAFARGRFAEAAERLEALILRFPGSALVPEARRALDRARGLVPRT